MKQQIKLMYKKLFSHFGPQYWWPADTPFEVMLGAILTQNTSWANVEKAIKNLKKNKLISAARLYKLSPRRLASLIRSTGYYNIKTKRLKDFLDFFITAYCADIKKMAKAPLAKLRAQLLSVRGIGPETADSILLYALAKPVFVVDAYTRRILLRHHFIKDDFDYQQVQDLFMHNLGHSVKLFNEFHALLVKLGKDFCLRSKPNCGPCPLKTRTSAGRSNNEA